MSNNKFDLWSGRPIVLLRHDSCHELLNGSQEFYLFFPHFLSLSEELSGRLYLLGFYLVSCCIYIRTGYGEKTESFLCN